MCLNNCSILFCFGVGGHNAQVNRLAKIIIDDLSDFNIITFSDLKIRPEWSNVHYVTGELRKKQSHWQIFSNLGPLKVLMSLIKIKKEQNVKCVISTGPGISILTALFFKFFNVKIVHIETWSRFESKSLTGKIMYMISDRFYIQNKSLKKLYPKAIYSGML